MEIGIDLGGTKIAAGLVHNGKIIKKKVVPTGADKGKKFVMDQLKQVIDDLSAGRKITGVGIGVPGTYQGTKLLSLPHVTVLNGVDIKKELRLKFPLALENDAKAFALAEHRWGAAKGKKHVIGLILGTGVGSGIIIDGKVYRGHRGMAGEIGHQIIDTTIPSFKRGDYGSWERLISGPGVVARHKARDGLEDEPPMIWRSTTYEAKETCEETIRLLTIFVANLQSIFDPEVIVLGGGLSTLPLVPEVNKLLPTYGGTPILKQNKLGLDAGILGAVCALK